MNIETAVGKYFEKTIIKTRVSHESAPGKISKNRCIEKIAHP